MKYIYFVFFFFTVLLSAQKVGPWDLNELYKTPQWKTTNKDKVNGYTSILYKSIDYLGKSVEVYAYYAAPKGNPPSGGWPAVVFAHGGGGTAFTKAVERWNDKGYAAISMDLEGHYPITKSGNPNPGPSRVGVWDDFRLPIERQWYYHAVAQIIIGHSLIASFPEVNAKKIGVMGASWGGTLTSTVMGVDSRRWAWAAPVYGAGYLSESDGHQGRALADGAETAFVNANYDGRVYFNRVNFPTLWLNGTNDFHFALTCNQRSSRAVNGEVTLRYSKGFGHSNLAWQRINEVYAFADQVVKNAVTMPKLGKPSMSSRRATVSFTAAAGMRSAQLLYVTDDKIIWPDRVWNESSATISGNRIVATVPNNAKVFFFTATDSRGLMVTSEYLSTSDVTPTDCTNLALNGTARQSSTVFNGVAERAIDNDINGAFTGDSVTHTEAEPNAFWQVTLDSEYNIGDINIYGRTDACCVNRLSNFTVLVFDSNGTRTYARTFAESPNPFLTVDVGGVRGNLVRIRSNTGASLSLSEVQVCKGVTLSSKNPISINKDTLDLYPNPVSNAFQIDAKDIETVEIYNISGQLVKRFDKSTNVYSINELSSGIYLVKTGRTKGRVNINKLIKQ